jgi:DNA-binding beta-propeller fold protein YncE
MQRKIASTLALGGILGLSGLLATQVASADPGDSFLPRLVVSSTMPGIGDMNPYGVAFVPKGFPSGGKIAAGDVLVANFNDNTNTQGTGTTIVQLTPTGQIAPAPAPVTPPALPTGNAVTFFTSARPGLTTALGVLRAGFVLVGNVPTPDGTAANISQGALQVIDRHGTLLQTFSDQVFLVAPWDLAIDDDGALAHIFVSNVTTGTVSRTDVAVSAKGLYVLKQTIIAQGYTVQPNQAAVILGPTGLAFDERTGTLYVASTADNAIYAVPNADKATSPVTRGTLVSSDPNLRGPLALKLAPNGHLLAANGDAVNADPFHPSEIVELTKTGQFVTSYNVDPAQGGAFGLDTVLSGESGFNYAAVNDINNTISVYHLRVD